MEAKPAGEVTLVGRAVVFDHESTLVLRRSDNCQYFPGDWEIPGGKIESNETLDDGLRREISEETSLTVGPDLINFYTKIEFDKRDPRISRLYAAFFYAACRLTGDLELSDEHQDGLWIELNNLPGNLKLTPETNSALMECQRFGLSYENLDLNRLG